MMGSYSSISLSESLLPGRFPLCWNGLPFPWSLLPLLSGVLLDGAATATASHLGAHAALAGSATLSLWGFGPALSSLWAVVSSLVT